jgi:purine-nucleoside phosphorylase
MLRELTKADWQSILKLPDGRIPTALFLRGTRNLRSQYELHRRYFDDVIDVGLPNGIIEDVFVGRLSGQPVAYASVYGAPMTSEIVHIFGVLGTRLVVQTGCCGALADEIDPGDLVVSTEAFCGEGAARYYKQDGEIVRPTLEPAKVVSQSQANGIRCHMTRMFTTAALFAEGEQEIERWWSQGWGAVDMETATALAVAEHFRMDSLAIHFAFDNPRRREHILLSEPEKDERRRQGNQNMIELSLCLIREYLERQH